jgi:hypothetical protein
MREQGKVLGPHLAELGLTPIHSYMDTCWSPAQEASQHLMVDTLWFGSFFLKDEPRLTSSVVRDRPLQAPDYSQGGRVPNMLARRHQPKHPRASLGGGKTTSACSQAQISSCGRQTGILKAKAGKSVSMLVSCTPNIHSEWLIALVCLQSSM